MNGIELIALERKEQIEKHGWSLKHDKQYKNGELIQAAKFCIDSNKNHWPDEWNTTFMHKIIYKPTVERLVVAGAFYMAENTRVGFAKLDREINDLATTIDTLLRLTV